MLAQGVADRDRTRAFARYSLIGALAGAAGALSAAAPDFLVAGGFDRLTAFKFMFYAYGALGLVGAALYRRLPHVEMREAARARRSGLRAASSTSSPRCSASTLSPAGSRCSR